MPVRKAPPTTLTRRRALQLGVAAAAVGCGTEDPEIPPTLSSPTEPAVVPERWPGPAPSDWEPAEVLAPKAFALGVQVGDPSPTAAVCWTHYAGAGPLELVLVRHEDDAWVELERREVEVADGGYVHAQVALPDDGAWYAFAFAGPEGRSIVGRWRAPPPSGLPAVVFGACSCTNAAGSPFPVLSRAAEADLAFFVMGGDNVYADGADTTEEFRATWAENLGSQGFLDMRATTATYATWDDHEVSNSWGLEDVDPDREATAVAAFYESLPTSVGPDEPHYRSFRWGDTLELFVLDCRSERDPAIGQYISAEQLAWLIDGVLSSTAVFKVIVNSVPIADLSGIFGAVFAEDRWQGYPDQRQQVVDALAGIANVYFVSGDIHMGLVARLCPEGPGYYVWDVAVGPGGSQGNAVAELMTFSDQYPFATAYHTYTRFTADPIAETMVVEFVDADGVVLYAGTLVTG